MRLVMGLVVSACAGLVVWGGGCSDSDRNPRQDPAQNLQNRIEASIEEGRIQLGRWSEGSPIRQQFKDTLAILETISVAELHRTQFTIAFLVSPVRSRKAVLELHWIAQESKATHVRLVVGEEAIIQPLRELDLRMNDEDSASTVVFSATLWFDHGSEDWALVDRMTRQEGAMVELLVGAERIGEPRRLLRVDSRDSMQVNPPAN